jgi:geranylgeranyl diphosphate synthase type II
MTFRKEYERLLEEVNSYLEHIITESEGPESIIYKAMNYSLNAGGKRLRPILAYAAAELLDVDKSIVAPYAAAIEMIHSYSLIHDDLPCMDNDDYRRGKLTNHKVFGEAIAVLAGDALLNKAFEKMLEDMALETDCNMLKKKVHAAKIIATASGTSGMVGGQVVDLESEEKHITQETLMYMHRKKTGALIKASVMAPAVLSDINSNKRKALEAYAEYIGIAFQIKDDIMDVEGSLEEMGKSSGKDLERGKSTFITLFGLEESKRKLYETINEAVASLEIFGTDGIFLSELARYIAQRRN